MKILGIRKRFWLPPLIALISLYILSIISPNVEVHHVYNVCPSFVFYTNNIINKKSTGVTKGIFVIIKPNYKNDNIILTHELTHVKQTYRYCFFSWLICLFSDEYIAKMEAEAYTTQITRPEDIPIYTSIIHEEYTPNVDKKIIEGYIKKYYFKP
jgi:hypothetical protein